MGLTNTSVGLHAADTGLVIQKRSPNDRVVALAGNPNVGKSTVFNALTGMNQHTGNWPGKTVTNAQGCCSEGGQGYVLVDLPGTYSLMAHSAEEEVARDFICFGGADATVVVCDATCLERNLNLVLQTLEITPNVVVCVNLMDEARRKQINIDLSGLSHQLGVPVVGTTARKKRTLTALMKAVRLQSERRGAPVYTVRYIKPIEQAVQLLCPAVEPKLAGRLDPRWLSLRLLEGDPALLKSLRDYLGEDVLQDAQVAAAHCAALDLLAKEGIAGDALRDKLVAGLVLAAEGICADTVRFARSDYNDRDRAIDRLLTGRYTGYPVMLALLALVFWLTIVGANVPSQMLSSLLFGIEEQLGAWMLAAGAPAWLHGALVLGVWRGLAWVVSVMLPPMAIFFPLFTLLEDVGYLPRVAYNLDKQFKRCAACGKQALTMCMGFGCNAAGIVGCRIIDSPRERLIAMLTNSFVPCNGRLPPPSLWQQSYRLMLTRRQKWLFCP